MDIDVMTSLTLSADGSELSAGVLFDLKQSLGLCIEHLQVSTAFSDYYNFYMLGGKKSISLTFTDPWEIEDVRRSGLRFFTYCADPITLLHSTVMSAMLWVGGNGMNQYVPMFGLRPTNY